MRLGPPKRKKHKLVVSRVHWVSDMKNASTRGNVKQEDVKNHEVTGVASKESG